MALTQRRPGVATCHSDQGAQQISIAFGLRCEGAGARPSMGDACDDAMCESLFGTLECELLARRSLRTKSEARPLFEGHRDGLSVALDRVIERPGEVGRTSVAAHMDLFREAPAFRRGRAPAGPFFTAPPAAILAEAAI